MASTAPAASNIAALFKQAYPIIAGRAISSESRRAAAGAAALLAVSMGVMHLGINYAQSNYGDVTSALSSLFCYVGGPINALQLAWNWENNSGPYQYIPRIHENGLSTYAEGVDAYAVLLTLS